jgi:ActR/RegA family two-component response regulator
MQISIIDDNPSDFPIAELRKDGYKISVYKTITLTKISEVLFSDIVFLDMKGVVKDDHDRGGLLLIQELRKQNPLQKICAVSGHTFDVTASQFFKLADDYKKKPLTAHECKIVIEEFAREIFSEDELEYDSIMLDKTISVTEHSKLMNTLSSLLEKDKDLDQVREKIDKMSMCSETKYRASKIIRIIKQNAS